MRLVASTFTPTQREVGMKSAFKKRASIPSMEKLTFEPSNVIATRRSAMAAFTLSKTIERMSGCTTRTAESPLSEGCSFSISVTNFGFLSFVMGIPTSSNVRDTSAHVAVIESGNIDPFADTILLLSTKIFAR
jgi:hypothetical protein